MMTNTEADHRSAARKLMDEQIAAEPQLPPDELPPNSVSVPMEKLLHRTQRHPMAFSGVVENGVVRIIDPGVKLKERARVIVVAESA